MTTGVQHVGSFFTGPTPSQRTQPASAFIQPHGISFGISHRGMDATIVAISDSCERLWGLRPEEVLDKPSAKFMGAPERLPVNSTSERAGPMRVHDFRDDVWYFTLTRTSGQTMVHLEPSEPEARSDATLWLAETTEQLEHFTDAAELWQHGCETVRARLGSERVVVMRLHKDAHTDVIAESVDEGIGSLLGLHVPAPSRPSLELAYYSQTRSTNLVDIDALPSLIVPRTDHRGLGWNVSLSPLALGAPHHLTVLRKMGGVAADFSINLHGDAGLEYILGSQSVTPTYIDPLERAAIELYARMLHHRVSTLRRSVNAARRSELAEVQHHIVERFGDGSIADSLAAHSRDEGVLDLVTADAAIISVGTERRVLGDLDEHEAVVVSDTVRNWVDTLSRHGALLTDRVRDIHPRLADAAPRVAGLLAISIGAQGDFVCWVRRPVTQTVHWLDLTDSAQDASPSTIRRQTDNVADSARPWSDRDRFAAEELARDVQDSLLRRAQAELAQLALVDALTGLPNRRLLLDRLEKAIGRAHRGRHFALLFLDLNDFKAVNDTFGHQAGDEVLVETARRLEEAVRDGDTVARLAGDEFVVLCEDTRQGEEALVAERIRESFAQPFTVTGGEARVGVAIGVGHLELGLDAPSLLDRADRAMYEAKSEMKRA